jgi:hypothetical protein
VVGSVHQPVLITGIDPVAEAKLVGCRARSMPGDT